MQKNLLWPDASCYHISNVDWSKSVQVIGNWEDLIYAWFFTKWYQTFRLSLKFKFSSQIWTQLPNQMGHKITLKTSWIDSRSLRCKSAFNSLKRKKRLTHLIYAFRRKHSFSTSCPEHKIFLECSQNCSGLLPHTISK